MLRPLVLSALAPAALLAVAAAPAAARPGVAPSPPAAAPPNAGPSRGPSVRGPEWRGGRHAGAGRHGYGRYGRYGYGGFGYGGGYGTAVVNGTGTSEVPDWGYRVVTAPGIEERTGSRPVVYVLDAPGRARVAHGRFRPYGGSADPEYGPRIVSLSVPRR